MTLLPVKIKITIDRSDAYRARRWLSVGNAPPATECEIHDITQSKHREIRRLLLLCVRRVGSDAVLLDDPGPAVKVRSFAEKSYADVDLGEADLFIQSIPMDAVIAVLRRAATVGDAIRHRAEDADRAAALAAVALSDVSDV